MDGQSGFGINTARCSTSVASGKGKDSFKKDRDIEGSLRDYFRK